MTTSKNSSKLMKGVFYLLDKKSLRPNMNAKDIFDEIVDVYEPICFLERGVIIPMENKIERIKFDGVPTSEIKNWFFTGFLYEDNTATGKAKYVRGSKLDDELFNGFYQKSDNSDVVIIWGVTVIDKEEMANVILLSNNKKALNDLGI